MLQFHGGLTVGGRAADADRRDVAHELVGDGSAYDSVLLEHGRSGASLQRLDAGEISRDNVDRAGRVDALGEGDRHQVLVDGDGVRRHGESECEERDKRRLEGHCILRMNEEDEEGELRMLS